MQWLPNLEARALEAISDAELDQEDGDNGEEGQEAKGSSDADGNNGRNSNKPANATKATTPEEDESFCLETGAGEVCPQLCKPSPGAAPPPRATLVLDYTSSLQQALGGGANKNTNNNSNKGNKSSSGSSNKGKTTRGPLRVEEDLSLLLSGEPGLSSLNYHRSEVGWTRDERKRNTVDGGEKWTDK